MGIQKRTSVQTLLFSLALAFASGCTSINNDSSQQGPQSNKIIEHGNAPPIMEVNAASMSAAPVEAYLSAFSVEQGGTLLLYTNTSLPEFHFRIYSMRPAFGVVRAQYEHIPGIQQTIPTDAWRDCCDWGDPFEITIPEYWESGLYRIQISTNKTYAYNQSLILSFVVRDDIPGSESQILVLDTAPHQMSYNRWGGASSYWHKVPELGRAGELSISRPGNNTSQWQEEFFQNWTQYMGITTEYASMMDIEVNPDLLYAYQTVILVAHSEYWSGNQRNALDNFIAGGGNVIILGGNNMWWQVRFEDNLMLIYKDPYLDPMLGVDDSLVTYYWHDWPINDPENRTIGLSFRKGGMVGAENRNGKFMPFNEGHGGYTVSSAQHRFLAGTGLANGSQFGRLETIVGIEVDGAEFEWVNGNAIPTGTDGTPDSFEIIAIAPAAVETWQGYGTMGEFSTGYNSGRVFNAATIDWAYGLFDKTNRVPADPYTHKIMLNVLAEFQPDSAASCVNSAVAHDFDNDGIDDTCDNCIVIANPQQLDTDLNGTGDLCEAIAPVTIGINIKPWDNENLIDPNKPTFGVAFLSEDRGNEGPLQFDATEIDIASLRFGSNEAQAIAEPFIANFGNNSAPDMAVLFSTNDAGFSCAEHESESLSIITGQTTSGVQFEGMQKVTVPESECGPASCHP
ncbi:MAG: hypothetical protein GY727_05835 [Gammaproteobacteria bacterium]|nr:hypothetical protein [Gammaproteobacteria bacterium]MCP4091503.1 hypothetical protein [Gammaproteobacteria bacterium]MCP4275413.1 hypothetical protein [Gammaproteobacteria bacterium]MCP4832301.1 hypothetical protein [Gammaproteobacteria bacterium]MCP4928124.1 hypothetical protein [Gammaproteobacteria bacterium]